jgi:hypothetical protein
MGERSPLHVPCPPRDNSLAYCRWITPPCGRMLRVVCATDYTLGVELHWIDGVSVACTRHLKGCQHCGYRERKWYCCLVVWNFLTGQGGAISIPDAAYRACKDLQARDGKLLHQTLSLGRCGQSATSPWAVTLTDDVCKLALPDLPTVEKVVAARWGIGVQSSE